MGHRFGWLAITRDLRAAQQELLSDLRGAKQPRATATKKAADHFMWKVDDDLELAIGFGSHFTLVQGQYDLGLSGKQDDALCEKYSTGTTVFRFWIEDTSSGREFKKLEAGKLIQSDTSLEDEVSIVGPRLENNADGYAAEWEFVAEVEQAGIPLDDLQNLDFTIYNYRAEPVPDEIRLKRWFEFWK